MYDRGDYNSSFALRAVELNMGEKDKFVSSGLVFVYYETYKFSNFHLIFKMQNGIKMK